MSLNRIATRKGEPVISRCCQCDTGQPTVKLIH